jgi:ketosteroid isomerase-like protein
VLKVMSAGLAIAAILISAATMRAAGTPAAASPSSERSIEDPLMVAARAELAASNRHDLSGFLQAFTQAAVILVDAAPYAYHGQKAFADFFRGNLLGTRAQYTINPGAPQTEDRVGDHAYLEFVVNVHATDTKGDSFNDPIHWIAALARHDGRWKIDVLTLTTTGG